MSIFVHMHMAELAKKFRALEKILQKMGSVLIAYSGGVDSTFLLKVAHDVLGEKAIAVTAASETYTKSELNDAKKFAKQIGARHIVIKTSELNIKGFAENTAERCYFCKRELFSKLAEIARENRINFVLDASNYDDLDDYRPGMNAAKELGIRSPLVEARLAKQDIRELSRQLKLPTWNKPSMACLSSRFPYGSEINARKLGRVEKGEEILKRIGLRQVRVRHQNEIARIETGRQGMKLLLNPQSLEKVVKDFKKLGFAYVTLDLQGYRSGSMNEVLGARKNGSG